MHKLSVPHLSSLFLPSRSSVCVCPMSAEVFHALPSSQDDRTCKNPTRKMRPITKASSNNNGCPTSKPSLSSLFFSLPFFKTATNKNAFRGLGCTSAPDVENPAPSHPVARSSVGWEAKKSSNQRVVRPTKGKRKKNMTQIVDSDMWCSPGIPFSADAESVDCVVSHTPPEPVPMRRISRHHRSVPTYSTFDMDPMSRANAYIGRPNGVLEDVPVMEPSPGFGTLYPTNSGYKRGLRLESCDPEEIVLLQSSLLFDRMNFYDRFHDLRLDIDNMTYEELLELGDKIGYVNTGLDEGQIAQCLRKTKRSSTLAANFYCENEWKCCICQEDYEWGNEVGKLNCGHSFHLCCIKQWLLRRNACPFCKVVAYCQ